MGTEQGLMAGFCVVLIILVFQFARNQKKDKENFLQKAKKDFGVMPDGRYEAEERERFSHYFRNNKEKAEFYLDDLTWNDLGMEDIFLLMNQTYSSVGEDYLYWLLRTPVWDEEALKERDRLITYFQTHEEERTRLQFIYHQLGRMKKHSISDYLIRLKELSPSKNSMHYLVIAAELLSVGMLFVKTSVAVPCLIASFGYAVYSYYRYKAEVEFYYISLKQISGMLKYTEEFVRADCEALKPYTEELLTLKRRCSGLTKGLWLISAGGMSGSVQEVVLEYVRMFTHIDLIQFQRMLKRLKEKENEISRIFEIFGYMESMIAMASFRKLLGVYCVPEFLKWTGEDGPRLEIEEMYHPQIENPVANSIRASRGVLLTGSNASGKSTFLKTVGICHVLAQTSMTVPARCYRAHFFTLYSSMALKDNLRCKESYYLAEIKAIRRMFTATEAQRDRQIYVLCLVDEVLRGTNTVERIAASAQILKALCDRNVLCFAATHDIELTGMLENDYTNYHFEEKVSGGDIQFDYQLKKGCAVTRNAIRLLSLLEFPEELTEAAECAAREFVEKGEWKCL